MEIGYDKLAAATLRQQQQQPSVAREVVLEWEGKMLGQWHKLGANFWIHAHSGKGAFFICFKDYAIIIRRGGGPKNELRKKKYYTIPLLSTKAN